MSNGAQDENNRAYGSLTLTIQQLCTAAETQCAITVELDSEYNAGRSCFGLGDYAYFRVYTNISVYVRSTNGNPVKDASGLPATNVEYVTFSNFSGSTSKPIHSITSMEWIGNGHSHFGYLPGSTSVFFNDSSDGYAVAKITYVSRFDRWKIRSTQEGDLIAYAIGRGECSDSSASVTIQFRKECVEGDNEVTIVAKDFLTNENIVGASVYVDGYYKGVTDSDGRLYVGTMDAGEHTVRIVASGYTSTDGDTLENDTFIVST